MSQRSQILDLRVLDSGAVALFRGGVPHLVRQPGVIEVAQAERDLLRYGWRCSLDEWVLDAQGVLESAVLEAVRVG